MADISFDDLIPAQSGQQSGELSFDDLIPAAPAQASRLPSIEEWAASQGYERRPDGKSWGRRGDAISQTSSEMLAERYANVMARQMRDDAERAARPPRDMPQDAVRAVTDQDRAAANDPRAVAAMLDKVGAKYGPEERAKANEATGRFNVQGEGMLPAAGDAGINSLLASLPRMAMAGYDTAQGGGFEENLARRNAMAEARREAYPRASENATGAGLIAQTALMPQSLFASPMRAAAASGTLAGVPTAINTGGDVGETAKQAIASALLGGAAQAATSPMRSAAATRLRSVNRQADAMSADNIRAMASDAYKRLESSPEVVQAPDFTRFVQETERAAGQGQFLPDDRGMGVLKRMQEMQGADLPVGMLERFRQRTLENGQSIGPAADMIRGRIDDFFDTSVSTPDAKKARTGWRVSKKLDAIENRVDQAEGQASRSGGGGNFDNALRQKANAILERGKNPRDRKVKLSAEEEMLLRNVVDGTKGRNVARSIGKLAPQNALTSMAGGLGAGAAIGGAPGAIVGLASPMVGMVAKRIAEGGTRKAYEKFLKEAKRNAFDELTGGTRAAAMAQAKRAEALQGRNISPMVQLLRRAALAGPIMAGAQP